MVELQVTNAVPDPTRLLGVIVPHVRLAGTVSVRDTVPAKPLSAVIVMVEVEVEVVPARTDAGNVAEIVKSWTMKSAVAEWMSEPLVPVTVRV